MSGGCGWVEATKLFGIINAFYPSASHAEAPLILGEVYRQGWAYDKQKPNDRCNYSTWQRSVDWPEGSLQVCDIPWLCAKVHSVNGKASCAGRPMFMPQRFQLGQREMPQGLVPRKVTAVGEGCNCQAHWYLPEGVDLNLDKFSLSTEDLSAWATVGTWSDLAQLWVLPRRPRFWELMCCRNALPAGCHPAVVGLAPLKLAPAWERCGAQESAARGFKFQGWESCCVTGCQCMRHSSTAWGKGHGSLFAENSPQGSWSLNAWILFHDVLVGFQEAHQELPNEGRVRLLLWLIHQLCGCRGLHFSKAWREARWSEPPGEHLYCAPVWSHRRRRCLHPPWSAACWENVPPKSSRSRTLLVLFLMTSSYWGTWRTFRSFGTQWVRKLGPRKRWTDLFVMSLSNSRWENQQQPKEQEVLQTVFTSLSNKHFHGSLEMFSKQIEDATSRISAKAKPVQGREAYVASYTTN